MLVGDCSTFAIESQILHAYAGTNFRALGFFVLHLRGRPYGVRASDATMLGCSFEEVGRRLSSRGKHHEGSFSGLGAGDIADAFTAAIYGSDDTVLGLPDGEVSRELHSNELQWAPDGDQAFDDGSYVLQSDVESQVRLIGFKHDGDRHMPASLREVWLDADNFYGLLRQWHEQTLTEWLAAPKVPARGAEAE
jgi:hypothetical protein